MSFIELESVYKRYKTGSVKTIAADNVTFSIEQGELCMIVGQSGAGKTTILNILGGIDSCDDGRVRVAGELINRYSDRRLTDYRRYDVGFVFQFYNLLPNLTALENVEIASQISNKTLNPTKILEKLGLGDRLDNFPSQLSGGEQQRVAIARALAKNPKLLLCDEPTGALDYKTGKQVLNILQELCHETGMTVVIITHNQGITPIADRIITMKNGHVSRIEINETPLSVDMVEW